MPGERGTYAAWQTMLAGYFLDAGRSSQHEREREKGGEIKLNMGQFAAKNSAYRSSHTP